MRALVYDCSAGISGDMNLAALIDLGADRENLERELSKLHVHGEWKLECSRAQQHGIRGTRIDVLTEEEGHSGSSHAHHHRTMADIRKLIETSALSNTVKRTALSIFTLLAEAEARVHGTTPEEVHFHEVGAVDSIIDIAGAAICLEMLRVDAVFTGPVELGSGTVTCQHGTMPVPAPATALLAKHFRATLNGTTHEATTPTGAAYIAALAQPVPSAGRPYYRNRLWDRPPPGTSHTEYSAGDAGRNGRRGNFPELLTELCANIDDMTPEQTAYLAEKADGGRRSGYLAGVRLHEERPSGSQGLRPVPAGTDGPRAGSLLPAQQYAGHQAAWHAPPYSAPGKLPRPHSPWNGSCKNFFHARSSPLPESGI